MKKTYDSTVARIAGNLLSGVALPGFFDEGDEERKELASKAVAMALAIVTHLKYMEEAFGDRLYEPDREA